MIPVIAGAALLAFTLLTPQAFAQENATGDGGLNKSLLAVAAAIAIAGGLIGYWKCSTRNRRSWYGYNCRKTREIWSSFILLCHS